MPDGSNPPHCRYNTFNRHDRQNAYIRLNRYRRNHWNKTHRGPRLPKPPPRPEYGGGLGGPGGQGSRFSGPLRQLAPGGRSAWSATAEPGQRQAGRGFSTHTVRKFSTRQSRAQPRLRPPSSSARKSTANDSFPGDDLRKIGPVPSAHPRVGASAQNRRSTFAAGIDWPAICPVPASRFEHRVQLRPSNRRPKGPGFLWPGLQHRSVALRPSGAEFLVRRGSMRLSP